MTATLKILLIILTTSLVHIRLDPPVQNAQVDLILYRIEGKTFWEIPAGSCRTNEAGECQIRLAREIRDRAGFLRGYLLTNGVQRPIIWPGGVLNVEIPLVIQRDEAYDYLETPQAPAVVYQREKRIAWLPILLAGLAAWVTFLAYRAAKKQEHGG